MTARRVRAGPSGSVRPCSQLLTVAAGVEPALVSSLRRCRGEDAWKPGKWERSHWRGPKKSKICADRLSGSLARAYFGPDARIPLVAGALEVKLGLHVDPIIRSRAEVACQSQRRLPADPPLARYDAGNAIGRHMQRLGQVIHADFQIA